ncbi:MAG: hypothetical protein A3K30_05665 [Deltaproteobacteria bacterium RBG_13_51_10]|nr:MAG: hypothetical protein A3K30_05665 [Deltaproteobacteria bacterium RBG_13_51_10]
MNRKNVESASDRAFKSIKEMIFNYQLIPGQNIDYIQLAERLKMSKTPIINGLHRLEQEEFVVLIPNRGFFIKEIDIREVTELFEIREALELLVLEGSARKQSPEMLAQVEQAMIAHREYPYDVITRKRQLLDMKFHLKIAEISGNRNLFKMLENVFERIYLRYRSEILAPKRAVVTKKEHQIIFDAIKDKNTGLAKRTMRIHVKGAMVANIQGIEQAMKGF